MAWLYLLIPIGLLACFQLLCWGPIFQSILRKNFSEIFSVDYDGFGIFSPFLYFRARNFRFMLHADDPTYDRVYLEAEQISFFIDPIMLLFGRVRIVKLMLRSPYMEYYNRVDSYKKNKFLPKRHKVEIIGANIHNGRIYIRDETMKPVYRIELKHINLENMDMDIGSMVDLLFRTERGSAQIASGRIEIGQNRRSKEGYIRLWGLTWSELTSLDNMPLMGQRLALKVLHSGGSKGRNVSGHIGYSNTPSDISLQSADDKSFTNIKFDFDLDWNEYCVTIDLGLQRLIGNILYNAQTNWLTGGFIYGGKGVFNILKKDDGSSKK